VRRPGDPGRLSPARSPVTIGERLNGRPDVIRVQVGLLLVAPLLLAAAPPAEDRTFDGDYEYRNRSEEKLWVESVTGLAECGVLSPDCEAGVHEGRRFSYPAEVVIKWKVTGEKGWKTQALKMPRGRRDAELIFLYAKEGKWRVFYEQK